MQQKPLLEVIVLLACSSQGLGATLVVFAPL